MKPNKYPLPWCDKFDMPYYRINMYLCLSLKGWGEKQAYKPMATIIPWIDNLIDNGSLVKVENSI